MPARRRERNCDQSDSGNSNNNAASAATAAVAATNSTAAVFTRIAFVQRICMFAVDSVTGLVAAAGVNAAFRECVGCSAEQTFLPRAMLDALCADDGPAWREDGGCLPKLLRPRNWIEEDGGEQQQQQQRIKAHTPEWVFRLLGAQASTWRPVGYAVTHDAPQALCEHLYERFLLPAREWRVAPRETAGGADNGNDDDEECAPLPPLREHPEFAHLSDEENPLARDPHAELPDDDNIRRAVLSDRVKLLPKLVALLDHRDERVALHSIDLFFQMRELATFFDVQELDSRDVDAMRIGQIHLVRGCFALSQRAQTSTVLRREAHKRLFLLLRENPSAKDFREMLRIGVVPAMLSMLRHPDAATRGFAVCVAAKLVGSRDFATSDDEWDDAHSIASRIDFLRAMHSCLRAVLDCMMRPCGEAETFCVDALLDSVEVISRERQFLREHARSTGEVIPIAREHALDAVGVHLPIVRALLEPNSDPTLVFNLFDLLGHFWADAGVRSEPGLEPRGLPSRAPLVFLRSSLLPVTLSQLVTRARPRVCALSHFRVRQNLAILTVSVNALSHLAESGSQEVRAQLFAQNVPAKLTEVLASCQASGSDSRFCLEQIVSVTGKMLHASSSVEDARPIFDTGLVAAVAGLLHDRVAFESAAGAMAEAWRVCPPAQMEALVAERNIVGNLVHQLCTLSPHANGCINFLRALDGLFSRVDRAQQQRYLERFKALGGVAGLRNVADNAAYKNQADAKAFLVKFNL